MKKKIMSGVLALLMVCTMMLMPSNVTTASAANDDQPTAKYTDWAFNDDFTKVTINGKTYDNYVLVVRCGKELAMINIWGMYLANPYCQIAMTPDEYAVNYDNNLNGVFDGTESKYPLDELISINGVPWQESQLKDKYLSYFEKYYDSQFKNIISKSDLWNMLEDKSYNGLAYGIITEKLTKEQAAAKYDVSNMKVTVSNWEMLKTGEEFLAKNSGQAFVPTRLEYPTVADLEKAMILDAPTIETKTTVVLHLNNPIMTVTNNGVTKSVTLEAAPYAPRGTTLVPVRAITEAFGSTVEWYGITQDVFITKGNTTIKLKIGSKTAYVNDKPVTMLEAAQIINGRTVVPLRFISENTGYKVAWDGATSKITITN